MDNKRRHYFIEKSFQRRFILKFCAILLGASLVTMLILYLFSLHSTTVSILNSRVTVRTTADYLAPLLIQTVAIVTALVALITIAVTLLASHKIAGPLYRFKKTLESLAEGDYSINLRLRHKDQLQDVAVSFNAMISKVREQLIALKRSHTSMKDKLDNISEADLSDAKKSELRELKRMAAELQKLISYFKS